MLALVTAASPALAAEWHGASYGGHEADQSAVFVDASSVTRKGGSVRFWTKTFFETATATGTDEVDEYAEANCSDRSSRSLAFTFHTGDRVSEYEPDPDKIKYNSPGSIFSAVIGQVCDGSYLTGVIEDPRRYAEEIFAKPN
jgi:hypothetical protein